MTGTDDSSLAVHYDELPLWSALAGRLLLQHLPLPSRGRIVDIGCGTGFPSLELAARCGESVEVVGVDVWEAALAQAEIKAIAWRCSNATFVRADAIDLPLADASSDLVVSCLGLNNFLEPERALAEAARVLVPEGRIALVTNLRGQFRDLYQVLEELARRRGDTGALARVEAQEAGRTTIEGLRGIAARVGFIVERVEAAQETLRFATVGAMLRHHFMILAFLEGWRSVFPSMDPEEFERELTSGMPAELDGGISLNVPLAYVELRRG